MPADDVSDLQDVFDAINKLCETMRTSTYEDAEDEHDDEVIDTVSCSAVSLADTTSTADVQDEYAVFVSPNASVRTMEACRLSAWSDALVSPPEDSDTLPSDTEAAAPASEMYYTASSEVSLLSDLEVPERPHVDDESAANLNDERKECVMLGHVAAMRERFESMTRTNTPCPDLARSASPSLDVFRNITPSPDLLG